MSTIAKQQLLTQARQLYLSYGVKSVSMDDIARLMGISKKTIYNFISNKKDLVHAVVKSYIDEEEARCDSITENSKNAIDEIISVARHVQNTLKEMKPTLTYDLQKYYPKTWMLIQGEHFDFIEKFITRNLKRGIKEGLFRDNLNLDIIPIMYMTLARLVSHHEVQSVKKIKQSDLHETMILYHLHGILNANGRKELKKYLKNETI